MKSGNSLGLSDKEFMNFSFPSWQKMQLALEGASIYLLPTWKKTKQFAYLSAGLSESLCMAWQLSVVSNWKSAKSAKYGHYHELLEFFP